MAVENEKLRAILYAHGLNPDIMRVIRAYLPDGWHNIVIYDEEAVDEAVIALGDILDEDDPQFVQDLLGEMRGFHRQRRLQQGITAKVPDV
jgi:hypothetical protein